MISDEKIEEMIETMGELMRRTTVKRPDSDSAFGEGAMMVILYRKGSATAGELSEFLRVGSGRIANLLKTSEKKGIIQREHCDDDKRKVMVTLTEKGRELHEKRAGELKAELRKNMSVLTEEEFELLLSIYKKILGARKDVQTL